MDIHTHTHTHTHTSEPVKVEIATGKFKKYKSLGTDQILAELIKARGENIMFWDT
jgi:hypothetical protein